MLTRGRRYHRIFTIRPRQAGAVGSDREDRFRVSRCQPESQHRTSDSQTLGFEPACDDRGAEGSADRGLPAQGSGKFTGTLRHTKRPGDPPVTTSPRGSIGHLLRVADGSPDRKDPHYAASGLLVQCRSSSGPLCRAGGRWALRLDSHAAGDLLGSRDDQVDRSARSVEQFQADIDGRLAGFAGVAFNVGPATAQVGVDRPAE